MLRVIVICILLSQKVISHDNRKPTDIIDPFFDDNEDANCTSIAGELSAGDGCYECYICGGVQSNSHENRKKTQHKIKLFDKDCNGTEFCCYDQQDSVARISQGKCGVENPSGVPRTTRTSLRSVLPGEYPWRTWIFKKADPHHPICAGIIVDMTSRAVLTSATCIDDYVEDELLVGFSRDNGYIRINENIFHEHYDRNTRQNDIVIMLLSPRDRLPKWASVVCLPVVQQNIASSCIAVSKNDLYVNIPMTVQRSCFSEKGSLLCAMIAKDDYQPELGSGLFCEKEMAVNKVSYVVYGIYLYGNGSNVVFTDLTKQMDWIYNKLNP